jgi:hypothetical protein
MATDDSGGRQNATLMEVEDSDGRRRRGRTAERVGNRGGSRAMLGCNGNRRRQLTAADDGRG